MAAAGARRGLRRARRRGRSGRAPRSGEAAFAGSIDDLIRNAPVVDEFKALDAPIVRNSIRFRWRDVREELRRRLDAAAVAADWRRGSAAETARARFPAVRDELAVVPGRVFAILTRSGR